MYNKINSVGTASDTLASYDNALKCGKITSKEALLWKFVLSSYAMEEFSTKQFEKISEMPYTQPYEPLC